MTEAYDGRQVVGMDLHRRRSVLVRMTEDGRKLETVRITNSPAALRAVIARAGKNPRVVIEATYGWYWAVDVLEAAGAEVHLAHPLGVKAFSYRRVKNDERDAADLADLLRMGRLPEAWIAPPEIRELREISRYRHQLVKARTSLKDQVHGVLAKLGIPVTHSDIFGVHGQAWLDELPMPQPYAGKVASFGTDRYPPFTLADDPSYPAHLEVEYPQRLSRGLALVKWWLLAIPQYIIVALFTGGGLWLGWRAGASGGSWGGVGLIGILAVIAAVMLLVTGRYPEQLFDLVLGMNRWVLRVAGYAGLMTDKYPPFRLDLGGPDPGTLTLLPAGQGPPEAVISPQGDPQQWAPPRTAGSGPAGGPAGPGGWTAGRIISVIAGAVVVLVSLGLLGAGGTALWAQTQRHGGYVDLGTVNYSTAGYALASDTIGMHVASGGWDAASALIGTVRIRVTPAAGTGPAFAGIAPAAAASRYLTGVSYATVTGTADHHGPYTEYAGSAPAVSPTRAGIWTVQAAGPGTQTLTWAVKSGDWMVVAMNADGARPVSMQVNVAATLPALPWIAAGLLAGGLACLAGGVVLIAVPLRRASGSPDTRPGDAGRWA